MNNLDKLGNDMAFISGTDELESVEVISFSKEYESLKDLEKGNILLIQGKVEKRNNIQIIMEKSKIIG